LYKNRIEFTGVVANTAFDAFVLVQLMKFFLFTADGFLGAFTRADVTPRTRFGINFIVKQGLAYSGRTFFVADMGFVLPAKIKDGG
jgi:hypothetical protein